MMRVFLTQKVTLSIQKLLRSTQKGSTHSFLLTFGAGLFLGQTSRQSYHSLLVFAMPI